MSASAPGIPAAKRHAHICPAPTVSSLAPSQHHLPDHRHLHHYHHYHHHHLHLYHHHCHHHITTTITYIITTTTVTTTITTSITTSTTLSLQTLVGQVSSLSVFQSLFLSQKVKLTAENEVDVIQDAARQDHVIGTVGSLSPPMKLLRLVAWFSPAEPSWLVSNTGL